MHGGRTLDPDPIRGHIPWSNVDARMRAARSIWLATTRRDGRAIRCLREPGICGLDREILGRMLVDILTTGAVGPTLAP